MKILKYIGIVLLVLLGIYLLLCLLGPKEFKVEKSAEIEAPRQMIYNMVNNYEAWPQWSPWAKIDPEMKVSYGDKKEGVGATYAWTSDHPEVGNGNMKMIESEKGKSIKNELYFGDNPEPQGTGDWLFEDVEGKTKTTWTMDGGPVNFFGRGALMMMGIIGSLEKTFGDGLNSIKEIAEKRASEKIYSGYKIQDVALPAKNYVYNRQEVKMENIQQFYGLNLGALAGKVAAAGVEMDGKPSGLFYKWDMAKGVTDMAAAIPTKEAVNIKGASSTTLPGKRAVVVDYYGEYSGTEAAHNAIDAYMKDYGLLYDWPVIEEYVTDPSEMPDPKKWLTKVTYYIAEK